MVQQAWKVPQIHTEVEGPLIITSSAPVTLKQSEFVPSQRWFLSYTEMPAPLASGFCHTHLKTLAQRFPRAIGSAGFWKPTLTFIYYLEGRLLYSPPNNIDYQCRSEWSESRNPCPHGTGTWPRGISTSLFCSLSLLPSPSGYSATTNFSSTTIWPPLNASDLSPDSSHHNHLYPFSLSILNCHDFPFLTANLNTQSLHFTSEFK